MKADVEQFVVKMEFKREEERGVGRSKTGHQSREFQSFICEKEL